MKTLVMGGSRFMGRHLTWQLLARGHQVTLFNRGLTPDPFGDRVARIRGDRFSDDVERMLDKQHFDAVVDFICYTAADAQRAVRTFAGRIEHYVVISTGQVYLVRQPRPTPAKEEDYDGPLMAEPSDEVDRGEWRYGIGKRGAEDVFIEAWNEQRFPCTRLRLPIVNGEGDRSRRFETYVRRIFDAQPILLPGGGTERLRHVYAPDVTTAIARWLGHQATYGRAFNLAQDETPTLFELASLIAKASGVDARIETISEEKLTQQGLTVKAVSPFSTRWASLIDPTKAKAELGFSPTPLVEYVPRVVQAMISA